MVGILKCGCTKNKLVWMLVSELNESSMYNDGERDSRTLCDGDYNLSVSP